MGSHWETVSFHRDRLALPFAGGLPQQPAEDQHLPHGGLTTAPRHIPRPQPVRTSRKTSFIILHAVCVPGAIYHTGFFWPLNDQTSRLQGRTSTGFSLLASYVNSTVFPFLILVNKYWRNNLNEESRKAEVLKKIPVLRHCIKCVGCCPWPPQAAPTSSAGAVLTSTCIQMEAYDTSYGCQRVIHSIHVLW